MLPLPNPIHAASNLQQMAKNAADGKLAFTLNGLSVALITVMLARELRDLMHEKKCRNFDRDEASRRQR